MHRRRHRLGGAEPERGKRPVGVLRGEEREDRHLGPDTDPEPRELGGQHWPRVGHRQQDQVGEGARGGIVGDEVGLEHLEAGAHQGALQPVGPQRRVAEQQDSRVREDVTQGAFSHGELIHP